MHMNMFSYKDIKTGRYNFPFAARFEADAIRSFENAINAEDGMMAKYPEDFELWCIGGYNDVEGDLVTSRHFIINGISVKKGVIRDESKEVEKESK